MYAPLQNVPGQRTIRLLSILPQSASRSEDISCELRNVSLDDNPTFEALSYVWESPEPTFKIALGKQRRSVTSNLHDALTRIRQEEAPRTVWIDALCINQDDLDERSQQVALKKDIYKNASRVMVWLGEDDGAAAEALEIIDIGAAWCKIESQAESYETIDFDLIRPDGQNLNVLGPNFQYTAEVNRPWAFDLPDVLVGDAWQPVRWLFDRP